MEKQFCECVWDINAEKATGNNHRMKLLGTDLIFGGIDNVFVYPFIDVNRLKVSLSKTLSFWPILTGRVLFINNEYFIEFSDHSIPLKYVESNEIDRWPQYPVIVDDQKVLEKYIDTVKYQPEIEPLIRLKLTKLTHSNEFVLGTSFIHMVGDAASNLHFLHDVSQIYQNLEPSIPRPSFEKYSLNQIDEDLFLSPIMKHFRIAQKRETILSRLVKEFSETDTVHLSFSSEDLHCLHQIAKGSLKITIHDALCAYLITSLNKYYFEREENFIRRIHLLVNIRGIDETLIDSGAISNAIMQLITSDFVDCCSLKTVSETIRQSIESIRNKEFLRRWCSTSNVVMKQMIDNGSVNFVWDKDEIIINSNYRYDWANQVHFGYPNQCRFHTAGLYQYYFRIFRLNPFLNDQNQWIRDQNGAEIAFRLPKGEKIQSFLNSVEKDKHEKFVHVR